jgi:hypothetical protein
MFNLSYLSTDRKRTLRRLQERAATTTNYESRNEANLLIQEIMAEAKPYTSCDLYEASELKNQLLDQVAILSNLGKTQQAEAFQIHLKDLDFYIQTKQMEAKMAEKSLPLNDEPATMEDRSMTINSLVMAKRKQKAMGRTRWVIGMEDDEVETKPKSKAKGTKPKGK